MSGKRISNRRRLVAACLALAGAVVGYVFGRWLVTSGAETVVARWSDAGALFLSLALFAQGIVVLLISLSRRASGEMLTGEDGRRASPEQTRFQQLQASVLILAGIMLALPVIAPLLADAGWAMPPAIVTMSAILLCFAVQSVLNLVLWRRSDEFVRRLIAETSSACFWLLQAALFVWAAGERLGLLPAASTWDCAVVLMAVYLVASGSISMRNGAAAQAA